MKTVKVQEALKEIKRGLFFKRLLIHGEEFYLTDQFLKKISAFRDIEKYSLDNLSEIYNYTGTSLFGDSPLLVITEIDRANEVLRKKAEKEKFLKFLLGVQEFILVSFGEIDYKKLKTELFTKILKLLDTVIISEKYTEKAIYSILKKKFDSAGKKVSLEILKLIVELVGDDLTELRNETDKLLLYPGELTPKVVKLLLFSSGKVNVFDLVFLLLEGKKKEYIKKVNALLSQGVEPLAIIALLQTQVRQMVLLACRENVRLPKDVIQKYKTILKRKKLKDLLLLLKALDESEFAVKRGRSDASEVLKNIAFGGS
ncbi:MAG: DNA polymerase III subunit delta [Desulfurobacteriaceae bacterium]